MNYFTTVVNSILGILIGSSVCVGQEQPSYHELLDRAIKEREDLTAFACEYHLRIKTSGEVESETLQRGYIAFDQWTEVMLLVAEEKRLSWKATSDPDYPPPRAYGDGCVVQYRVGNRSSIWKRGDAIGDYRNQLNESSPSKKDLPFRFDTIGLSCMYDVITEKDLEYIRMVQKRFIPADVRSEPEGKGLAKVYCGVSDGYRVVFDTERNYWPVEFKWYSKNGFRETVDMELVEVDGHFVPKTIEHRGNQKSFQYTFEWVSVQESLDPDTLRKQRDRFIREIDENGTFALTLEVDSDGDSEDEEGVPEKSER